MNFYKHPTIYGSREESFSASQATTPYVLKLNPNGTKEKLSKVRREDEFPQEIWIKVQISPKQMQKPQIQAQLSQNNIQYTPCAVYEEKSLTRLTCAPYSHSLVDQINLVCMDITQAIFSEKAKNTKEYLQKFSPVLKEDNILHSKKFQSHPQDIFVFRHKLTSGLFFTRLSLSQDGYLGLTPIYAYGGFYNPGVTSLKDIHQTYFMIMGSKNKTKIALLTQDKISQFNLNLPKITRINQERFECLTSGHSEALKSLHQEISDGDICFNLHQKELGLHQQYQSFGYQLDNPSKGFVEIGFRTNFD